MRRSFEKQTNLSGRVAEISSIVALPVTLILAVAATVLDDSWQDRAIIATVTAAAFAIAFLLWWSSTARNEESWRQADDLKNMNRWHEGLRHVMRQTWVGPGSPLRAINDPRQDLLLKPDNNWLHQRQWAATHLDNDQELDLNDCEGPGGLWERLDGSYLVVGEPGSGKSVLLWQTLEYLLDQGISPLLVELFHWAEFDSKNEIPSFVEFIAWRLGDPSLGAPPDIALVLAGEVVLLLDGLDELVEIDEVKAQRFLHSLARATEQEWISDRIVLTSRPSEYKQIADSRGSGTRRVQGVTATC